ncbi:hypothetical protein COLO4_19740 [Corchorus olitorius]|uniref:Uncharacterized protein n=1 Tax=Corchorus olitorius TaxID=93759 RepID=A0A1R3J3W2_9ROSI|nr:hypothetical protein COLO4_19740 [Corchorus olitorius]
MPNTGGFPLLCEASLGLLAQMTDPTKTLVGQKTP